MNKLRKMQRTNQRAQARLAESVQLRATNRMLKIQRDASNAHLIALLASPTSEEVRQEAIEFLGSKYKP